jgi:hypothetical protein
MKGVELMNSRLQNIAVGSEPLYDWAIEPAELARQVNGLRSKLSAYGIKTSEFSFLVPFLSHLVSHSLSLTLISDYYHSNLRNALRFPNPRRRARGFRRRRFR